MSRKNRKSQVVLCTLIVVAVVVGCGSTEDEKVKRPDKLIVEDNEQEEKQDLFLFRDVKGNEYEVALLAEVPKVSYDYSRLVEENGLKYYKDKMGNKSSTLGIDVSEYQTNIDWPKVKEAEIEFAIIRVGYRGYGQAGSLIEDAMFRTHMEGAQSVGLDLGVYFFSQAINQEETLEEAEFVKDRIKDFELSYPVVFDTEEIKDDTSRTEGIGRSQFTENCVTFCNAIEEAGYASMIYANMKWMAFTLELEKLTGYAKWYADYEATPQCPYEFTMWQYTESGSIPGVEGNVDLNVAFTNEKGKEN